MTCGGGFVLCPVGFLAQCAPGTGFAQPACVNGVPRCCTSPDQCAPVLCVFEGSAPSCCNDFDCGFTTCAAPEVEAACADGQDNDGDGVTDYPGDPGCDSSTDTSEAEATTQCQNGFDDDGDGKTDYPDDPGCASRLDDDEATTSGSSSVSSAGSSLAAALVLSLSDSRTTVLPGEIYSYGVTVSNTGQTSSTVSVTLDVSNKITIRSASSNGSVTTNSSSSIASGSGRVTWNNVSVGANATVILTAEVEAQSVLANGTVLNAKAEIASANLTANDQTTVLVITANDGCVDVVKETYDTANNILTPVTQFSFTINTNLSGSASSGGSTTIQNDGGGRARFAPIAPGTYTVTETVPSTWTQLSVTPTNGSVTVTAGTQCAVVTFKNKQVVGSSSSASATSSFTSSVSGVPQCSDGLDNDGDGVVDYPADPGCVNLSDTNEGDATTQCQNGKDDDGDGRIDMSDAGCKSQQDNNEVDTFLGTSQFCTVAGVFCDTVGLVSDVTLTVTPSFTCKNTLLSGPIVGMPVPQPSCKQCNCSSSSSRISVQSSTSRSSSSSSRSSSSSSSSSSSTTSSSSSFTTSSSSSFTTSSRSSSSFPFCGDGRIDSGEQCGEPGLNCPSGQTCSLSSCRCSGGGFCGDGRIDSGEQCGEPGLTCGAGDTCSTNTCTCNRPASFCGDGDVDPGEQCGEPSLSCGSGQVCNTGTCSCVSQPVCGNGRQDQGEQCGEPGISCPAGQTCSTNTCQCAGVAPFCGNGQQDAGEQCGEPGLNCPAGQNCANNCLCSGGVICGNGRVDAGEQCNEPGLSCPGSQTCGLATCLCSGGPSCGNDRADRGEQCGEPGLTCAAGQTCNTNSCLCTTPPGAIYACGNNQVEPGEECDDGNTRDNDGCSQRCFRERGTCGDGIVQTLLGEQCEPAIFDRSLPYQCGQNCRFVSLFCGDGKRDAGEECDLGADNSNSPGATCRTDCSTSRCGDNIVDPTERCDDGNRVDGDGCNRLCQPEPGAPPVSSSVVSQPGVIPFVPGSGKSLYSSVASVFPFPTGKALPGQVVETPPLGYIGNTKELSRNGPPIVAVIAAGAAAGVAWMRRKRQNTGKKA